MQSGIATIKTATGATIILAALFLLSMRPTHAADNLFTSPGAVALYSLLLPGSGQLINGYGENNADTTAGAVQLGAALGLHTIYQHYSQRMDYLKNTYDESCNCDTINATTAVAHQSLRMEGNLSLYSSYAAWRDGLARRNQTQLGSWHIPAPRNTIGDLAWAPFNPRVLTKPEVWIPTAVVGAYTLYGIRHPEQNDYYVRAGGTNRYGYLAGEWAASAYTTAIGEEAFFRGIMNPALASWGGPWTGVIGSAAIFGLAHDGQSGAATRQAAFLYGLLLGGIHYSNDYDLAPTVALHFWNNFFALLHAVSIGQGFTGTIGLQWGARF